MEQKIRHKGPGRPRKVPTPYGTQGSNVPGPRGSYRHSVEFKYKLRQNSMNRQNKEGIICECCGKVLSEIRAKSATRTCDQKCRVKLTWMREEEAK